MKLSTIAKASLALGILTTGIMTTNAQSVSAATPKAETTQSKETAFEKVKAYYSNGYTELRNVNAYAAPKRENVVVVKDNTKTTAIKLKGIDQGLYTANLTGVDVFVVNENNPNSKIVKTTGGITKTNKAQYFDYVASPSITVAKKGANGKPALLGSFPYLISKEQISLKELDFKIKKLLIQRYGLYEKGLSNGKIRVVMDTDKKNDYYTFQLNRVLEEHRMGVIIDPTKIKKILVTM
ncbi:exotoxin beta-grasp domain-containing protein [Staphylococcus hyicus]|uniref:exotoxin beta-grasp domain-containing protein n=1 Tax=Staphylococcus hyicus TaxID=1284 RepID=UPI00273969F5|nr:exotoxin beta-grasp domain-containing protein [Staphylococcus hyicus]MDP4448621.1 exotoxin beta-grasp domain-containing protein [Staphylococcus hyicus]